MRAKTDNLILYDFFDALRTRLGIELGIRDYLLLGEALERGYGLVGDEDLLKLCETLWLKSKDKQQSFRRLFFDFNDAQVRRALDRWRTQAQKEAKSPETPAEQEATPPEEKNKSRKEASENQSTTEKDPLMEDETEPAPRSAQEEEQLSISLEDSEEGLSLETDAPGGPTSILSHQYILSDNYYPLSERDLKNYWRYLRTKEEEADSREIDLEDTIADITKDGILDHIYYEPTYTDRHDLVFLLDHSRAMIAFYRLSEMMVRTARTKANKDQLQSLFFDTTPRDRFFSRPDGTEAVDRESALLKMSDLHTKVIIFSDAGAATRSYDPEQLTEWWTFLDQLKAHSLRIVWLNPMPRYRWAGTMAEFLGSLVPMFGMDKKGFAQAVRLLRGLPARN